MPKELELAKMYDSLHLSSAPLQELLSIGKLAVQQRSKDRIQNCELFKEKHNSRKILIWQQKQLKPTKDSTRT